MIQVQIRERTKNTEHELYIYTSYLLGLEVSEVTELPVS